MAEDTCLTLEIPARHETYWREGGRFPVFIKRTDRLVTVSGIRYKVARNVEGGYYCYKPSNPHLVLGEVYQYGVRRSITTDMHRELSALRCVLFPGTSYPSPLCYEMRNGDLVHPGPCFLEHKGSHVKTTKYQLTGTEEVSCAHCGDRIL